MLLEPYVSDRQCEDCLDVYPETEFRFDNKAREHVKVCRHCEVDRAGGGQRCTCCKRVWPRSGFSPKQGKCKKCRVEATNGTGRSPTAWHIPRMTIPESIACQQFAAWRGKTTPGLIGPSIHARIAA